MNQNYNWSTQQKMEPLTKEIGEKLKNKISPFIKGVIAFLLVTLSLFHVFFANKSNKIPANDKKYAEAINYRNTTRKQDLVF